MGHDDIIMTAITATEFFGTTDYADYIEELLDVIAVIMISSCPI